MRSTAKSHGLCGLGLVAKWFMKLPPPPPQPILPNDIIYYILLLLPVKSLAQCRCVCREWNNLLTGSNFLKNHLDYARRRLIVSSFGSLMSMDLEARGDFVVTNDCDFPWNMTAHFITGSCNGLLCLLADYSLFLWNPSTRQCKQLPPPPSYCFVRYGMFYGFGYDKVIDGYYNYKVVRGENNHAFRHGNKSKVEVYTRKTNSWKRIQDLPYYCMFQERGTFINGSLHWLAIRHSDFCAIIASLDLAKEEFREILLPEFELQSVSLELGTLNGMLSAMYKNFNGWSVYAMKEYGVPTSWIILITIPSFVWTRVKMPFYLMKNGELVLQVRDDKLLMYDPRKNTFKELIDTKSGIESTTYYVESLESP
ncbi:F-box protein At3g07870-like [Cornus florida]|uniref:F-box protein At3g07870-like n=1 Tax=Cornus florida TaxID=4283 RepID=UPI0028A2D3D6|nr:F-box protein At3g07870-like [Cornus florida]